MIPDHLSEARHRARDMLSTEAHLGAVDDWRRALVSARDAAIVVWMVWLSLHGLNDPAYSGALITAVAFGVAVLMGVSTARSTHMQVQHYADELERERREIRDDFDHEREEIRVLYAAKGFTGKLLDDVVETLCADDDRLLKVMMEEELGLHLYHMNHPLIVGVWNFGAAMIAGLALALPALFASTTSMHWWMPIAITAVLLVVSVLAAVVTERNTIECFVTAVVMAGVAGGVAYFLARWLATVGPTTPTG
jgi:VIT1/CCC1 family predicted Fe2+/Mn2+ transporter